MQIKAGGGRGKAAEPIVRMHLPHLTSSSISPAAAAAC